MTASESARHDLYNGLTELLGPQRAETLMAAIPAHDISDLATKDDLRAEMAGLRTEIKNDLQQGLASVNLRIDRLILAWVGGLIVIVGAMAGVVFMP
jgi:hypothetical protein